MKIYNINYLNFDGVQEDYAEMWLSDEEDFFQKLEDAILTFWGFVPEDIGWKKWLRITGTCYFKDEGTIVEVAHAFGDNTITIQEVLEIGIDK